VVRPTHRDESLVFPDKAEIQKLRRAVRTGARLDPRMLFDTCARWFNRQPHAFAGRKIQRREYAGYG
jgi:hypothetical protein